MSVIEEILWLGRWRTPVAVRLNAKLVPGSGKDVDCCFRSEGITINLEVKYRPRTWLAGVDDGFDVRDLSSLFDSVDGKFPLDPPQGTYNVVALTILAPIDSSLRHHATQFLASHPEVATVVVWTDHAPNGRNHEFISGPDGPARLLECLFKSDEEERSRAGFIRHPMRNTAERREMTPGESIRLMQRIGGRGRLMLRTTQSGEAMVRPFLRSKGQFRETLPGTVACPDKLDTSRPCKRRCPAPA